MFWLGLCVGLSLGAILGWVGGALMTRANLVYQCARCQEDGGES